MASLNKINTFASEATKTANVCEVSSSTVAQ